MRPVVIVNFKTYPEGTGKRAVKLAKLCEEMGKKYGVDMRVAVQTADISRIVDAVKIPVYAQHVDSVKPSKNTGFTTVHAIKDAGASGSLLNHAEHQLDTDDIKKAAAMLHHAGLHAVVCAESIRKLKELDKHINPSFFCVEPPELIGGDVSVSVANPDIVMHAVQATKHPVLVGAGVKRFKDVEIALEMGAKGVLLASGVVMAKHQEKAFRTLLTEHGRPRLH